MIKTEVVVNLVCFVGKGKKTRGASSSICIFRVCFSVSVNKFFCRSSLFGLLLLLLLLLLE